MGTEARGNAQHLDMQFARPRVKSVLSYKFPFVELPGLIDLGAKFPFLKEDLSGLVKTGTCFQSRSRRVDVPSRLSAILNHLN